MVTKLKCNIHKVLGRKNSTVTLQRAMRWRVLLEAFGPDNEHIKRVHDTVADTMYTNIKQHVFCHEIVYKHKTIKTAPQSQSNAAKTLLMWIAKSLFLLDLRYIPCAKRRPKLRNL